MTRELLFLLTSLYKLAADSRVIAQGCTLVGISTWTFRTSANSVFSSRCALLFNTIGGVEGFLNAVQLRVCTMAGYDKSYVDGEDYWVQEKNEREMVDGKERWSGTGAYGIKY